MPSTSIPPERRDRRVAARGASVAAVLLAYLLWPSESGGGAVDPVPEAPRAAPPAPAPPPPGAPGPSPAPTVAAATPDGLVLHGVMASGAVIGFPGGDQRYIAVGREVMPGLRLEAVRLHHAVLTTAAASYRLGFGGSATALPPAGQPATAAAQAAPAFSAAEAQRQAAERIETSRLRQALAPRQANGQVTGYTLRPGFSIPTLAQAGLQPGDTILAINGSRLGTEQFEELAWTIANSNRTEFEIERGGRRIRLIAAGTP